MMLGGSQTLTTPDGSIFPLVIKNGLCYLKEHRSTDWEMKLLPQVIMTSVESRDPTTYDSTNNTHNKTNITVLDKSKQFFIIVGDAHDINISGESFQSLDQPCRI